MSATTDKCFRITTAWVRQLDESAWLLSAYDERTEDFWGGEPEWFRDEIAKARKNGDEVRIVEILVDPELIDERFSAVTIEAADGSANYGEAD